jgi:hypothetical protein
MAHPHPLLERKTGSSGEVWWYLRVPQGMRDAFQMTGLTNVNVAQMLACGVASDNWHWSLCGGLSVVFRHEADALEAAARWFDDRLFR